LSAEESLEYINNSPDTLHFIYFHLWPNAYKNKNTALAKQKYSLKDFKMQNMTYEQIGFVDSLDFKINGEKTAWIIDEQNIDICKLILNKPLYPIDTIIISTPFFVKIPDSKFSRLGHYFQSYQITQWYPKPAVYDKKGWHQMPYLDMGEFYSEFGSFDVSITVPRNYLVAATGNLQNADELEWLSKKADETAIKTNFDSKDVFPKSDTIYKTLRYTEKNIHDFAWFCDKRFNVLKGEVSLPHSKKTVTTWTFFTDNQSKFWKNSIQYVDSSVYYYSLWNGDYPYKNCTAIDGALSAGGGMEYPTITVIGNMGSAVLLEQVIMHEVGHNWFYGILGSNERDNPWLDEGINSFYELRYMQQRALTTNPDNSSLNKILGIIYPNHFNYFILYMINARRNLDQPITLHSEDLYGLNYQGVVYMKTAYVFNYLKNYLGEAKFDSIMQIYYKKWQFKHPDNADIIAVFKENCKENLDWFFDDLIASTKRIDYKITSLKKCKNNQDISRASMSSDNGNCWNLKIKNKGQIKSPFQISALKNDSVINSKWFDGFEKSKTINLNWTDFDKLTIDSCFTIPDINYKNNSYRKTGLFKTTEPLRLQFFANLENPKYNQIYFLPAIAWNNYNKFMIGGLFYNSIAPIKKLEYVAMPLYSFGTKDLAGSASISYNIFPINYFQFITLNVSGSQYSINRAENLKFQKVKSSIDIKFKNYSARKNTENRLTLSSILATNLEKLVFFDTIVYSVFNNCKYSYINRRLVNPYSVFIAIEQGKGFVKSSLEAIYKISYGDYKKGLNVRLFAGKFLYNASEYYGNYNFRLSGNLGYQDYTYDNIFLGRLESNNNYWISHQFVKNDGGFSIYSAVGQTNDWISTLGLTSSIPGKLPLRIYFNLGTYADAGNNSYTKQIAYEGGVTVVLIPDIFEVYLPALMSEDLKNNSDLYNERYYQKIRFILNLNKLYPFKYMKEFIM